MSERLEEMEWGVVGVTAWLPITCELNEPGVRDRLRPYSWSRGR